MKQLVTYALIAIMAGLLVWVYANRAHPNIIVQDASNEAAEAKARELGAAHWTMLAQETMRPEVVGRYYGRQGYQPLERSYIKEL